MKAELRKMKFYVTNSTKNDVFVKSFEEVIRIIEFEMKDFIGKEKIKLDEAKNIEELEKMIETLNVKNKNNYEITVVYPVIIDYDKKVLFYSSEVIIEYFKENAPDFYKRKNIKELSDPYDLIKFGIEVKEVWNAEF
jgi:hypothetical protein